MAARRLPDHRTLASHSRINLLHRLQESGAQTVHELAEATGLHHNTAREHLHQLIDAGFVDVETILSTQRGRPRLRYFASREASDQGWQSRREASRQRTELVQKLLPLTDISTPETPKSRQLDALDDHMVECGFDAEISADETHLTMTNCPFGQLAKENPQVCEVHLNLIKDALQEEDGPLRAGHLQPFCDPETCTLDLDDASTADISNGDTSPETQ